MAWNQKPIRNHVDGGVYCHGVFIRCHICNSNLCNKFGPRTIPTQSKSSAKWSLQMWQMQISRSTHYQCACV